MYDLFHFTLYNFMTAKKSLHTIRSFVRRGGRLTHGQQRAIDTLWSDFSIDKGETLINLNKLFGRNAPKVIEIGFGNGASLTQMAMEQPEQDFLGVEVHRPGVGQLLKGIEKHELPNLRLACADAVELLKYRITDNSIDRVQCYFPDPWHKNRHHKRRLIQPAFVSLLAKKIKAGGHLHLATDWQHYAEQMLQYLSDNELFENCSNDATYIDKPDYRPLTKYERRGQKLGHGVWDLLFKRK